MPTKLKVLVALLGAGALLDLAMQQWLSAILAVLLVVGVFKGHEAVRTLLLGLAWLGVVWGGFIVVATAIAVPTLLAVRSGADVPVAAGDVLIVFVALVLALFAVARSGFFLWCLRQKDVQHWMFRRSLALPEDG